MHLVLAYAFVVSALIALWLGLQWYLGGGELPFGSRREQQGPAAVKSPLASKSATVRETSDPAAHQATEPTT